MSFSRPKVYKLRSRKRCALKEIQHGNAQGTGYREKRRIGGLDMKETVIAIYDIGKTNKKIILFNEDFKIVSEIEEKFTEVLDDDGIVCDDIEHIEKWIKAQGLRLPDPVPVETLNEIIIDGKKLMVGTGIHDSSASLDRIPDNEETLN